MGNIQAILHPDRKGGMENGGGEKEKNKDVFVIIYYY